MTETIWQSQCLPQETARDGAARFVRETFNSERKIVWCNEPGMFRFPDGYWCYIIAFNGGHWQVRRSHQMTPQAQIECPYCGGNGVSRTSIDGHIIAMDCPECGGTGWE
jgi:DnaJ-class molecular chaperone